jgi:hypothetical protein
MNENLFRYLDEQAFRSTTERHDPHETMTIRVSFHSSDSSKGSLGGKLGRPMAGRIRPKTERET